MVLGQPGRNPDWPFWLIIPDRPKAPRYGAISGGFDSPEAVKLVNELVSGLIQKYKDLLVMLSESCPRKTLDFAIRHLMPVCFKGPLAAYEAVRVLRAVFPSFHLWLAPFFEKVYLFRIVIHYHNNFGRQEKIKYFRINMKDFLKNNPALASNRSGIRKIIQAEYSEYNLRLFGQLRLR